MTACSDIDDIDDTDIDDTDTDSDSDTDSDTDTDTDTNTDTDTSPVFRCMEHEVLQPGTSLCWRRCLLGRD